MVMGHCHQSRNPKWVPHGVSLSYIQNSTQLPVNAEELEFIFQTPYTEFHLTCTDLSLIFICITYTFYFKHSTAYTEY